MAKTSLVTPETLEQVNSLLAHCRSLADAIGVLRDQLAREMDSLQELLETITEGKDDIESGVALVHQGLTRISEQV